jgi:hypothetical protein
MVRTGKEIYPEAGANEKSDSRSHWPADRTLVALEQVTQLEIYNSVATGPLNNSQSRWTYLSH